MDLLIQVLLVLVFILSLALYFQIGSQSQQQPHSGSGSAKGSSSSSSKSKSKKKSKKATTSAQASTSQLTQAKTTDPAPKNGGEDKAPDVFSPPAASVSDEVVALPEQTRDARQLTNTKEGGSETSSIGKTAAVSTRLTPRRGLDSEDETVDLASYRDHSDRSQRPVEDAWQSVGKGAARPNKAVQSSSSSYSSIASSNPFAVLPGDGAKPVAAASRSISIPASAKASSSKVRPPTSSQITSAAAAELTKRQRQNAARAAAAKQAKDEEEKIRLARLEAHRREAQRERIKEDERKKFIKGIHSSGPNGSTANGNTTAIRGNRGGLDSKASVNTKGQLVWD